VVRSRTLAAVTPTTRLHLADRPPLEATAVVVAVAGDEVALDRSPFYPGGGGQPSDRGRLAARGESVEVSRARAGADGLVWHLLAGMPADLLGQPVTVRVDPRRRKALSRAHTALHVLNTLAVRRYGALITGTRIGEETSSIDFDLDRLDAAVRNDLEAGVNEVLRAGLAVRSSWIAESEFRERPDLVRTLEAAPPVSAGRVRVVEIAGFDAQACGGTHAATTAEVGTLTIVRTDNKGRANKRLYVRLSA
jgi:misacylated tRNA(Ala) deacylase